MQIKALRQAMRSVGLGAIAAGSMAALDPALAGSCDSCDPGCATCQTCSSGSSGDQSNRSQTQVNVIVAL
jgi:hypothetical protein